MTTLEQRLKGFAHYPTDNLQWKRLQGGAAFDYPIDYWIAVLGTDLETGQAEFLLRWEPNAYCHYHRHAGSTTFVVLEGEHHLVEDSPTETVHKTWRPGHVTRKPPGDLHMEHGGPDGSMLFFGMQAEDGVLFEVLTRTGELLRTLTVEDLATGRLL